MAKTSSRRALENLAWKKTPRDYRSTFGGRKGILTMGAQGTTIKALADMSEAELIKYIGHG